MNRIERQAGVSMLGVLVIVCLFSFFLTVGLRLLPPYMEGRKVHAAVVHVAESLTPANSLREVNTKISSVFNTNMVEGIKPDDVKIYREDEIIVIDATYEARTNLFKGVDVVLVFDDLKVEVE